MIKNFIFLAGLIFMMAACVQKTQDTSLPRLQISENGRFFQTEDGEPFFWLGDTGWLLFSKLDREEAEAYFNDRVAKGFNVIQVMMLHTLEDQTAHGVPALVDSVISRPYLLDSEESELYDYWQNIDYLVDLAAEKGLYMALVPAWGNIIRFGGVTLEEAEEYTQFVIDRYKDRTNIIWLNGGDTFGNDSTRIWNAMGNILKNNSPEQLVTFHPRGRCMSSEWFHNESWMDFNMIQSGHRRYDQDDTERNFGEDNWRYIEIDYNLSPTKPTIDAEPSYEGIPHGLHDVNELYWNDNDLRRYAYWSVFAGAFGFTYGHNAIMQFYKPSDEKPAFGAKEYWDVALHAPGAQQMLHLKDLMLSRSFFDRVPDQSLIAGENGEKYDYRVATRGKDYAFIYTYTGGTISLNMDALNMSNVKASWFNPRNGEKIGVGSFDASGVQDFTAPGDAVAGNDWVLVLDSK